MNIHANGADGVIHVHNCPQHPNGSAAGGVACFYDADHDVSWRIANRAAASAALTSQVLAESDAPRKARIQATLSALSASP